MVGADRGHVKGHMGEKWMYFTTVQEVDNNLAPFSGRGGWVGRNVCFWF